MTVIFRCFIELNHPFLVFDTHVCCLCAGVALRNASKVRQTTVSHMGARTLGQP